MMYTRWDCCVLKANRQCQGLLYVVLCCLCVKLYCQGEDLPKEARDIFINGDIYAVRSDFQNLMNYCSRDVEATYEVFEKLMPMFFER